ncbi:hypothetical protein MTP03_16510 [Tsukamurella sp. PLM1]|nr:hypothetical protein MTP03_16510 [Tsukamurella sp. PLM1]
MVDGALRIGPVGREITVRAGDSRSWTSDGPHRFATVDGAAEAVVVITTPRPDGQSPAKGRTASL